MYNPAQPGEAYHSLWRNEQFSKNWFERSGPAGDKVSKAKDEVEDTKRETFLLFVTGFLRIFGSGRTVRSVCYTAAGAADLSSKETFSNPLRN